MTLLEAFRTLAPLPGRGTAESAAAVMQEALQRCAGRLRSTTREADLDDAIQETLYALLRRRRNIDRGEMRPEREPANDDEVMKYLSNALRSQLASAGRLRNPAKPTIEPHVPEPLLGEEDDPRDPVDVTRARDERARARVQLWEELRVEAAPGRTDARDAFFASIEQLVAIRDGKCRVEDLVAEELGADTTREHAEWRRAANRIYQRFTRARRQLLVTLKAWHGSGRVDDWRHRALELEIEELNAECGAGADLSAATPPRRSPRNMV